MRTTSSFRAGALACGAAACLGWALYRGAQRPRPADPSGWPLPRMAEFLAGRVPGLRVVPVPYYGAGDPGAYLTRTALPPERLRELARLPERGPAWAGTVYCEEARMSRADAETWGENGLVAGQFRFFGDPALLDEIRAALAPAGISLWPV